MKDDKIYPEHVLSCISRIERYVADGYQHFAESTLIQDAVLRNLQTLAESTQRLSDKVKLRHPEVPWRNIAGFRNILVHDYLGGINPNRVWEIIERELPALKEQMKAILYELRIEEKQGFLPFPES